MKAELVKKALEKVLNPNARFSGRMSL